MPSNNFEKSLRIGSPIVGEFDGGVLFADTDGFLGQDTTNFFWDNTNNRLGIGTVAPVERIHSVGDILIASAGGVANTLNFQTPAADFTTTFAAGVQAANITYVLPIAQGALNNVLTNDGTGVLSWAAGGAGAPADATYVTLSLNATLTGERVLTGTANQIAIADGGANGNVTLSTPQNIATTSTPQFARIGLGAAADATALVATTGQVAVQLNPFGAAAGNTGELRLLELAANGVNFTAIKSADAMAANVTYVLPNAQGAASTFLQNDGAGVLTWAAAAAAAPTDATYVTLSLNGTLTAERVLTGTANQIVITDAGANGNVTLSTPQDIATASTPQFARIGLGAAADATALVATTGQVAVQLNPFGAAAGNTGELRFRELTANGTNFIAFKSPDAIAANVTFTLPTADGAANTTLHTSGAGVLSFSLITLTTDVTGTLPIANGGTNSATALNNNRIIVSSAGALVEAGAMTNGQLLIGSTAAAPVVAALTGTANQVVVTNGAGSITLSTPQDIATASTPQFARIGLGAAADATALVGTTGQQAIKINPFGAAAGNTGELRLLELAVNGTNFTAIKSADAMAADVTYVLPNAQGAASTFLQNDGTGVLSWSAGAAGAPADATYVTLSLNGTLTAERVLTGTANQIAIADGGANGNVTLSTPQDIATASTPQFARIGLGAAADGTALVATTGQVAVQLNPFGAAAGNTGELRFRELTANGTNFIAFKSPDALAANVTFTLPTADGAANTTLHTSGAGVLSFSLVALTTDVSGILPSANGGTGVAFFGVAGPTVLRTYTFPDAAATIARTDAGQTFTGVQSMTSPDITTSITTPSVTFALVNATATTINFAAAATTLNIGASATCILNFGGGATASEFRFLEPSGSGTNFSAFKAVAQGANITYSLPPTVGAAGTVLTDAAGNGVLTWAAAGAGTMAIGGTVTGGTTGSVLFIGAGPVLAQDNANLFFDDANNRLGIGTAAPACVLHVNQATVGDEVFRISSTATNDDPLERVFQGRASIANNVAQTILTFATTTDTTVQLDITTVGRRTAGTGTAGDAICNTTRGTFKNIAGAVSQVGVFAVVNNRNDAGIVPTVAVSGTNILIQARTAGVGQTYVFHTTLHTWQVSI